MPALLRTALLVGAIHAAASGSAQAVEFRSIGPQPAVMYDAPSEKGRKVFVAPRNMPVEVVLSYGDWTKVRDAAGDLAWVESKLLSPKRHVVVSSASARVRTAAEDSAPIAFTAEKGVLLEFIERTGSAWVRVRHRDGQAGFVRAAEVWGE